MAVRCITNLSSLDSYPHHPSKCMPIFQLMFKSWFLLPFVQQTAFVVFTSNSVILSSSWRFLWALGYFSLHMTWKEESRRGYHLKEKIELAILSKFKTHLLNLGRCSWSTCISTFYLVDILLSTENIGMIITCLLSL